MTQSRLDVSIVVPVYRSESILSHLVAQVHAAMQDAGIDGRFELILVNDASPDGSWQVIRQLADRYPFVKGICLARNFGQHNATMAGLNHACGEVVVIMDDDLQHPPQTIMALVAAVRDGFDVCYTTYVNRQHAFWKRLGSWFNDRVASFLLNKPRGLYLSSYKAMHRRVAQEIIRYDGPYAYVDGLILDVTRHITSVPIQHQARHAGKGNYGLRRSISLWLKMATSFSIIPLRVASFTGLMLALVSAIAMIAVIVEKFRHPETPAGWASMLVIVLFMGGLQLLCLGVIGEYLGRAYLKLNRKPQFAVRERIGCANSSDIESGDAQRIR
jgi:undecaprenyl-phosphate 4-deoxy-4-formamido-L-arabinose transferase